jgi:hypothetical protein
MSVTINAKGTSVPTFTVGKDGTILTLAGEITPPPGNDLVVNLESSNSLVVNAGPGVDGFISSTGGTDLVLSVDPGNVVRIESTGGGTGVISSASGENLEINPGADLYLMGSRWPQDFGTNGQILTTDGSGILSWEDGSGGGGIPVSSDPTIVYATNIDGTAQIVIPYSTDANSNEIPIRTTVGQILAATVVDGDPEANANDLINRAYANATFAPIGGGISVPANEIVFGTGSGIDSVNNVTYTLTGGGFRVNAVGSTQSTSATPDEVNIFATTSSASGVTGGPITLRSGSSNDFGGPIFMIAGDSSGMHSYSTGGSISLQAGDVIAGNISAQGGTLYLASGAGQIPNTDGPVRISVGNTEVIRYLPFGAWGIAGASNTGAPGQAVISTGSGSPPEWVDVPFLDVEQLWLAVQRPYMVDTTTITSTSSFTYNPPTHGQVAFITLTNAITITFAQPTNVVKGASYQLMLVAGDTNARTYAFHSSYKFPSGVAPLTSGSVTTGAHDVMSFVGGASNTLIFTGSQSDVR